MADLRTHYPPCLYFALALDTEHKCADILSVDPDPERSREMLLNYKERPDEIKRVVNHHDLLLMFRHGWDITV